MEEGGQFGVPEKQDFVYVENIVHGMYCIEQHLTPNSEVGGQVYRIVVSSFLRYSYFKNKKGILFNKRRACNYHGVCAANGETLRGGGEGAALLADVSIGPFRRACSPTHL